MKRLLPFCLLAAILGANADTYFPVYVSNNGIIAPSSSVTIHASKPANASEDDYSYSSLSCQIKSKSDSPIRLFVSSSNAQSHDFDMTWDYHTFPSVITIDDGSDELNYDFDEDDTEVSIEIKNLDPMDTATINCIGLDDSYDW